MFATSTRTTSRFGVFPSGDRFAVTAGTSVTTTPLSESSRSLSRNEVRPAAESSDARLNCSGTITVANCDSPRGVAQTSSRSACMRPSAVDSTSSGGSLSAKLHQRGRMPGSVCLPGASSARAGPS